MKGESCSQRGFFEKANKLSSSFSMLAWSGRAWSRPLIAYLSGDRNCQAVIPTGQLHSLRVNLSDLRYYLCRIYRSYRVLSSRNINRRVKMGSERYTSGCDKIFSSIKWMDICSILEKQHFINYGCSYMRAAVLENIYCIIPSQRSGLRVGPNDVPVETSIGSLSEMKPAWEGRAPEVPCSFKQSVGRAHHWVRP